MKEELAREFIQKRIEKIAEYIPRKRILINEPMSAHTTFGVGGCADLFVEITSSDELEKLVRFLDGDFYLIGNGSNLLVSDKGLRGVVLHLSKSFSNISVNGRELVCEAGASLAAIARTACEHSLTGMEFAAGIPGSLGGAIVMNAGAYGGEMKQIVSCVKLMTYEGKIVEKSAEEMNFSYRHSLLKEENFIVLEAVLRLEKGNDSEIRAQMDDLARRRREKQPLEYLSAGSTFKRPEGQFAAKLIQDAGLSGFRIGDACVSTKHCGFVVNMGKATADDIYAVIKEVQKRVQETSGIQIEPEVICLGEFCL